MQGIDHHSHSFRDSCKLSLAPHSAVHMHCESLQSRGFLRNMCFEPRSKPISRERAKLDGGCPRVSACIFAIPARIQVNPTVMERGRLWLSPTKCPPSWIQHEQKAHRLCYAIITQNGHPFARNKCLDTKTYNSCIFATRGRILMRFAASDSTSTPLSDCQVSFRWLQMLAVHGRLNPVASFTDFSLVSEVGTLWAGAQSGKHDVARTADPCRPLGTWGARVPDFPKEKTGSKYVHRLRNASRLTLWLSEKNAQVGARIATPSRW